MDNSFLSAIYSSLGRSRDLVQKDEPQGGGGRGNETHEHIIYEKEVKGERSNANEIGKERMALITEMINVEEPFKDPPLSGWEDLSNSDPVALEKMSQEREVGK